MNLENATESLKLIQAARGKVDSITKIEIDYHGLSDCGYYCSADSTYHRDRDDVVAAEDKWKINVWAVNPKTGNRNLYVIRAAIKDVKHAKSHVRTAIGKATDADAAALRMAAVQDTE